MKTPKVSVLVPVYNGEPFLPECLDSILAQDLEDFEILIADDGSTDGSVAVVKHYAAQDKRIHWWSNDHNLGLARNFNCCLRTAQGEYIKYVLQDDKLLTASALRQMVEPLDRNPGASLVACASLVIDSDSRMLEVRDYFKTGTHDGWQVMVQCLEQASNLIGEPSVVMFRRAQATRGYDEHYQQLLDWEFWFYLLEQGPFEYVAEPLCAFRQHALQQTQVNRRNQIGQDESFNLLESYCEKPTLLPLVTRQMLFSQIYSLRRLCGDRVKARVTSMRAELTLGWYIAYWLKRKTTRPFKKMWRHWNNRITARFPANFPTP